MALPRIIAAALHLTIAAGAKWEVLLAPDSTADEAFAAQELSGFLANASGSPVPTVGKRDAGAARTFAVGYGAAISVGLPPLALQGLGNESYIVTSNATGVAARCVVMSGGEWR